MNQLADPVVQTAVGQHRGIAQAFKRTSWSMQAIVLLWSVGSAHAQNYPTKPVRLVSASPGGGADTIARILVQGLVPRLGQPVIVENRGELAGGAAAAKASPDGYTLLVYGSSIWLLPYMRSNIPWAPLRDFAPISHTVSAPSVLVVTPSLAAKNVKELIALAKAKPGELNYGSASTGSINHLAAELFKSMAGVNIVRVPFRGTGQGLTALMAGEVQMTITSAGSAAPHVKSGRLRALAVTSAEVSPLAPDLPTVAASGLPGYDSVSAYGVWAPTGTPKAIITRLNHDIVAVLKVEDVKQKLLANGVEVVASTPAEFDALIRRDITRFGKIIKDLHIQAE